MSGIFLRFPFRQIERNLAELSKNALHLFSKKEFFLWAVNVLTIYGLVSILIHN